MTTSGVVKSTTTSAPRRGVEQPVALVDHRHEFEVVGGVDGLADLDAHPAAGTQHADPHRLGLLLQSRGQPIQSGRALRPDRSLPAETPRPGPSTAPRRRPRSRSAEGADHGQRHRRPSSSAAMTLTSSRVTASIRGAARRPASGRREQLALAEPAHPGTGVLQAEHERALAACPCPGQLVLGDAVLGGDPGQLARGSGRAPRRPCPGRSRRRRRTCRCRRTARCRSRPSTPGRASRGSPGTGGWTCRRRARC